MNKLILAVLVIAAAISCTKTKVNNPLENNKYLWESDVYKAIEWNSYDFISKDSCIRVGGIITSLTTMAHRDSLSYLIIEDKIELYREGRFYDEGRIVEGKIIVDEKLYYRVDNIPYGFDD